uniref:Ionotropic glutamate receptor L-glutamate and glycine-binding domain-containing protein n=1 Tax=Strigamia maritima TaxID=126957 RepID=T1JJ08_STRMM
MAWISGNQTSNYTIKIGLINISPEMKLSGPDNNITLGGYFGEFFAILFSLINIRYQNIRIPDNKFGSINKNKTWNGMMKYLVDHKIDIGASLTQTRKRQDYVKFSPILYSSSYRLLYRQLDDPEWSYNFFIEPFYVDTWICVLLLSSVVILFAHYYKRKVSFKTSYLKYICSLIHDIFFHFTLCWPIALLTANMSTNTTSSRTVYLSYYLFVMLTILSYNSQLTAMLTIATYPIPFQSLDDMIIETKYFPVVVKGRSIVEMFSIAEQEPWKTGWEKILKNRPKSMVKNTQVGINTVYSTKAAFITTLESVQTIRRNCSFNFAPNSFGQLTDSIAYAINFPYIETIIQLREVGILDNLARRFYISEPLCSTSAKKKLLPVYMQKMVGIILAYTVGLLLSLIVGLIEIFLTKTNNFI